MARSRSCGGGAAKTTAVAQERPALGTALRYHPMLGRSRCARPNARVAALAARAHSVIRLPAASLRAASIQRSTSVLRIPIARIIPALSFSTSPRSSHLSNHDLPSLSSASSPIPRTIPVSHAKEVRHAVKEREASIGGGRDVSNTTEKTEEKAKPTKEDLARAAAQRQRKRREEKEARRQSMGYGQDEDVAGQAVAFCSAFEYDIEALLRNLAAQGLRPVMQTSDCVSAVMSGRNGRLLEVFYFQSGGFVCWGQRDPQEERALLESVRPFQRQAVARVEDENMAYVDDQPAERPSVNNDGIIVVAGEHTPQDSDAHLFRGKDRLTCSYALLKSVQLSVLEQAVEALVRETKDIPSQLASVGSTRLSSKDINIRLGRVLQIRSQLNQYWEIHSSPDITWDTPVLESLFGRMSKQLDIQDRCYFLNQRLDYAKETLDLVRQSAAEKHSHFLEQIIIVLIAMELLFNIFPVKSFVHDSILSALQWFH